MKKHRKSKFMLKKRLINTLFIVMAITAQAKFGSSVDTLESNKIVTDQLLHYSIEVPSESLVQPMSKDGNNMIMISFFEGDFPFGLLISESDSISDAYKKNVSNDRYSKETYIIGDKEVVGYQTKSTIMIVQVIGDKQYSFLINTNKKLSEHEAGLNQVLLILSTFKVLKE